MKFTEMGCREKYNYRSRLLKKNYDMVRKLIPEAEVFVAEENEEIQGFIGLTDTYIACREM